MHMSTFHLPSALSKLKQSGKLSISFTADVSAHDADYILRTHNYQYQRPVSEREVSKLVNAFENDRFEPGSTICFCVSEWDQNIHMINGQHRLIAQQRANRPAHYVITLELAKTESTLRKRYSEFDALSRNSTKEYLRALYSDRGWDSNIESALDRALRFVYSEIAETKAIPPSVDPSELSPFINILEPQIDALSQAVKGGAYCQRITGRSYILALALLSLYTHEDEAIDFWGGIAHNNGLLNGDPRQLLLNWLLLDYNYMRNTPDKALRYVSRAFAFYVHDPEPVANRSLNSGKGKGDAMLAQWRELCRELKNA